MTQFTYTAKRGLNETLEGSIEAESQDAAVHRLVEQGLFPVHIEPAKPAAASQKQGQRAGPPRSQTEEAGRGGRGQGRSRRRVTSKEVLSFTQKLTTLVRAQVDLLSAVRIIHDQADDGRFKQLLSEVVESTKEGQTFSESLARFPEAFSPLFVNIVRAGEASGKLDVALQQLAESLSRDDALRRRVRSALAYPILLMCVGLGSLLVLMTFVIPKLESLFMDLGGDLPLMTKIVLATSRLCRQGAIWVALGGGLIVGVILWRRGGALVGQWAGRLLRRLPVLKRLIANQELLHFASSLNLLLRSGVPALGSLQLVTPSLGDARLRAHMQRAHERVALGESLSKSFEAERALPPFFVKMIAVGEESGRLDEVLEEIARSYHQQIDADIATVSSLIEPVLILVMGSVLGAIVLSILLPIFQITSTVR